MSTLHIASRYVNDSAEVEEDPTKGVRGAPATHMSFSDIGATGCLMVGMTDNSVLLLGFRRADSGDWTKGLSGDHLVRGESQNTGERRATCCRRKSLSTRNLLS